MKTENWKLRTAIVLGIFLAGFGTASGAEPAKDTETAAPEITHRVKSTKEKASYSIGVEVVRNFRRQGIEVDLALVIRGMQEAAAGDKLMLSDEDMIATLTSFASEARAKQARARLIAGQENKKEGEEFLAANKTKDGVIALENGLQYKIIKAGSGKKPTEADTVECHYRAFLINGKEFDNTARTGEPMSINLSDINIIPGLREGLKLMPIGSKGQLFIPPQLAYGSRGAGEIGPYSTIIYELEVLSAAPDTAEGQPLPQEEASNK